METDQIHQDTYSNLAHCDTTLTFVFSPFVFIYIYIFIYLFICVCVYHQSVYLYIPFVYTYTYTCDISVYTESIILVSVREKEIKESHHFPNVVFLCSAFSPICIFSESHVGWIFACPLFLYFFPKYIYIYIYIYIKSQTTTFFFLNTNLKLLLSTI